MSAIPSWMGARLGDCDGLRVGVVCDVYFDELNHEPVWLLVNLLRVGERFAFVPAAGVSCHSVMVIAPHARETIRSSPLTTRPPAQLAPEALHVLCRHYGVRACRAARPVAVHGAGVGGGVAVPRAA